MGGYVSDKPNWSAMQQNVVKYFIPLGVLALDFGPVFASSKCQLSRIS